MVFTEIKTRKSKKYYYRVYSFREKNKVLKKRIYLGESLNQEELALKEQEADAILNKKNKKNKDEKDKKKESIEDLKKSILPILKKHDIKKAGIFGSYARGENTKNSDIDILVDPPKDIGFGYAKILFDLEKGLNKKIDLVNYSSLNPKIKNAILREEIKIL